MSAVLLLVVFVCLPFFTARAGSHSGSISNVRRLFSISRFRSSVAQVALQTVALRVVVSGNGGVGY